MYPPRFDFLKFLKTIVQKTYYMVFTPRLYIIPALSSVYSGAKN